MSLLTEAEVRELLVAVCRVAGSQVVWAGKHGLSPQYVSDVLHGKHPGSRMLSALGLERVESFRRLRV